MCKGKFNMGSTGSIRFCTKSEITSKHYKLIASKRHDGDLWGWTLIKVSEVKEGEKLPVVEYLVPGGNILSFQAPHINTFGDDEIGKINQGTVVRLFDYDIGDGAHQVDFGLYHALTLNLLNCALPIRIYDFNAKPAEKGELRKRGIASRTFSGMSVMLNRELSELSNQDAAIPTEKPEKRTTEFTHLVADLRDEKLGRIKILATGISELPDFMKGNKKRVFYTINGQTHATENASFLNLKKVLLGDLQNHLIVDVQCENMDKLALTIFMGNREQKVNNELSRKLVYLVQENLKNDSKLKQYQNIIRHRRASQIIEEDEETKKMLNDFVTQDPAIRELLGFGTLIKAPAPASGGDNKFEGKQFPTFLKPLNVSKDGDAFLKELPIGSTRKIICGTDAANDYLSRTNSPGRIFTSENIPGSASLNNGSAVFTFTAPSDKKIGDEINAVVGFEDDGPFRPEPLTFPLTLKITPAEKPKNSGGKPNPGVKKKPKESIADPTVWVTKDEWASFDFNETSGSAVRETEDGIKIHVNKDHEQLAAMRMKESDEATKKLDESRFKICLGLLTLAIYKFHSNNKENGEDSFQKARDSSDAMAPYILSLIKTLSGAERI